MTKVLNVLLALKCLLFVSRNIYSRFNLPISEMRKCIIDNIAFMALICCAMIFLHPHYFESTMQKCTAGSDSTKTTAVQFDDIKSSIMLTKWMKYFSELVMLTKGINESNASAITNLGTTKIE